MEFAWADDFSVGIQEIDEQHKVLVGLLNELHAAIVGHRGSAECRRILDRLVEYTRVHFAVEESLMRILGYPDYENHKHEHEKLAVQVADLLQKLDTGKAAISFELLHFLKVWLTKHICESDKRYGSHFIACGIEARRPTKEAATGKRRFWKFWSH